MSDEAPQAPKPIRDEPAPASDEHSERREERDASGNADPRSLSSGMLQRLRLARRARTVVRGYSFFGTLLAAGLFAASYLMFETELPRWICRLGAMGALLAAVVGLNVMDRIARGRSMPATAVAFGLALIAVALLGAGVGALRYELGAAWSPLVAATYVVVGVRILHRFQSAPGEAPR